MWFSTEQPPLDGPRFPQSIEEAVASFGYPVATLVTQPWLGPELETARYEVAELVDIRLKFSLDPGGHIIVRTTKKIGVNASKGLLDLTLRSSMTEILLSFEPSEKWGARHGADRWKFAQHLQSLPARPFSFALDGAPFSGVSITDGLKTAVGLTTAATHIVVGFDHAKLQEVNLALIHPRPDPANHIG